MSPEDTECEFMVDNSPCHLYRKDNGTFDIDVEERIPIIRPEPAGPRSSFDSLFVHARMIVWGAIALAVVAPFLWYLSYSSYPNVAARRADHILKGMSETLHQGTIGLWLRDTRHLDNQELNWAMDRFDKWRGEKDLWEPIKTWKIINTEKVEDGETPTAKVTVEIDGRVLTMIVPERMPITWGE